jgi:hypothetical protein
LEKKEIRGFHRECNQKSIIKDEHNDQIVYFHTKGY